MKVETRKGTNSKFSKQSLICRCLPILLAVSVFSPMTMAATSKVSSQSSVKKNTVAPEPEKKSVSLLVGLERSSNLIEEGSPRDNTATDLLLRPSWTLNENWTLSNRTIFEQEETGPRNSSLSDSEFRLSLKGAQLNDQFSLTHSISGYAPTNEENRKKNSFQGAATARTGIKAVYPLGEFSYGMSLRRNFHEYKVSSENSPNIEYSLSHAISGRIPLSTKWSVESLGIFAQGRTYGGLERQNFSFDFDVVFEAIKDFSINLGTSNKGSALKANGHDSNIKAFDEHSSVLRLGVSYVL
ncbi:MAG: hypothetical protein COT73_01330 [Bdellovibrio sp. CG10_big_fil_rev_8_21_14_0_10_47_8]|nr:MAG: hypothetical protein COT73_01330 [Bdellovibrio sp. CG10_big_fil_rev_8_21_14_0_10_47_8]